jgi:hypothetical protein
MVSIPINKKLYNRLKKKIKARSKVWPSAYASGQLVRAYKAKGGKYRSKFGSLNRWFKEKWVNVCEKGHPPCGKHKKGYPYCRPSKRINSKTPRTVGEISKTKLKTMCRKKKSHKKVFLKFGEKNNGNNYNMEKYQTCGFGPRRSRFGNNLGPTSSNLDQFYQPGTANNMHLNPSSCLSRLYNNAPLQRFGAKYKMECSNTIDVGGMYKCKNDKVYTSNAINTYYNDGSGCSIEKPGTKLKTNCKKIKVSFGKKRFIQQAFRTFEKKRTK